jgi:DNA repair protein RadC
VEPTDVDPLSTPRGRPPPPLPTRGCAPAGSVHRLDDHPRERLLAGGAEALSSADLLAVLLERGPVPRAAQRLAHDLLARFGDLRHLAAATPGELRAAGAGGPVSALRLCAAFALGRRVHADRLRRGRALKASGEIFDAFHARFRDLKKERFVAVLLDGKNGVLREETVSEGILTASLVHPREVFGPALRECAAALLLVHNHPSGDPEPSPEDVEVTRRLCAVGDLVGIRVLDHVVIGDGQYVSFLERGILPP